MDIIESEIQLALDNKCFLAALALALIIPSICGRYKYRGEKEGAYYAKWYNDNTDYDVIDGKKCYALRCALFHYGNAEIKTQSVVGNEPNIKRYKFELFIPNGKSENGVKYCYKCENDSEQGSVCVSALCMSLLRGYNNFKKENPKFKNEFINITI